MHVYVSMFLDRINFFFFYVNGSVTTVICSEPFWIVFCYGLATCFFHLMYFELSYLADKKYRMPGYM